MRGAPRSASSRPRQPGGGEVMAGQADRPVVGQARGAPAARRALPGRMPRPAATGAIGGGLLELQHPAGRFLVVPADPFGEPRARLDRVFQHVLGDEGAAALLDAHQPGARQFLQRAAHGVAVDAELLRQLGLGRQPGAGRQGAGADRPAAIGWRSAATARCPLAQHRLVGARIRRMRLGPVRHGFIAFDFIAMSSIAAIRASSA